jgi:N-acetylglutamate synthase-like GNAT family acetyltransferase
MATSLIQFDTPTVLSSWDTACLRINPHTFRSGLKEYQDSIFDVGRSEKEDDYSYIITRRKDPSLRILKEPLSPKRELMVSEQPVEENTLQRVGKIAREWQALTWEKKIEQNAFDARNSFRDLGRISRLIAECMESPEKTQSLGLWNKIYLCEDVALKEIQAIALTYDTEKCRKLSQIVTHPRNVRSSVNALESTRVEGAASAIIHHLAKTLPPLSEGIYLEALESAKSFYLKLGFEQLDSQKYPPSEWLTQSMMLTAEKIQKIFPQAA